MEDRLYKSELLTVYGDFLTGRQRKCLELALWEDFSLAEIADELKITRQAAHDAIKRGERAIEKYELALGVYGLRQKLAQVEQRLTGLLPALTKDPGVQTKLQREIVELRNCS